MGDGYYPQESEKSYCVICRTEALGPKGEFSKVVLPVIKTRLKTFDELYEACVSACLMGALITPLGADNS